MFRLLSAFVAVALVSATAAAATRYTITTDWEGVYPSQLTTTVVVSGNQWREDFAATSTQAVFETALIGIAPDKIVALNDQNKTWFTPRLQMGGQLHSMLLTYGPDASVSKVHVATKRNGDKTTIEFSYRISTETLGATVNVDVSGDASAISTTPTEGVEPLPISQFLIGTDYKQVDDALRDAITSIHPAPTRFEIHVRQRFEGGKPREEVIRKSITDVANVTADPKAFAIPEGYRYQEPVIGGPGGH